MPEGNEGNSEQQSENRTVFGESRSSEISSLRRAREASSPSPKAESKEGASGSESGQADSNDNREPAIPRDRFDQVNTQKNQYQQEAEQLRQQLAQVSQFIQQQQYNQQQQPAYNPTGMVGQQPQPQPQQQQQNLGPDFSDPEVQKQWRKKLGENPIGGMVEMFRELLRKEGTPLLDQYARQIEQRIQPIQQTYVQQQIGQYAQQRVQNDPSFQQVRPVFDQVVQQALRERPNLALTPQTLQVLEGVARVQSQNVPQFGQFGQAQNQAQNQNPPFTERPGGQAPQQTQDQGPQLTPQQRAIARKFQMTDAEYAAKLQEWR